MHNDEYRAAIQYMKALCRTIEITCTIDEMCALPPKLGVKRCIFAGSKPIEGKQQGGLMQGPAKVLSST